MALISYEPGCVNERGDHVERSQEVPGGFVVTCRDGCLTQQKKFSIK
jgi:hypothetical protein